MNPFRLTRSNRGGVTIVEVLTSIIVAVIGVAGVLVLIPFGIRQAQTGLDLQDSTTVAENADQEFQLRGFARMGLFGNDRVLPWIGVERERIRNGEEDQLTFVSLTHDSSLPPPANLPVGWYFIDPLWLSALADPVTQYPNIDTIEQMFRYVGNEPADEDLFLNGVPGDDLPPAFPRYVQLFDLIQPAPNIEPIDLGLAAQIFQARDDLQFAIETNPTTGDEIDELSPPVPYLDQNAAGLNMRRQFEGSVTWAAVAVPKRKAGDVDLLGTHGLRTEGFDFYVMVFKDRSFQNPTAVINRDDDPRFLYTTLSATENPNQIFSTATVTLNVAPGGIEIANDSWVMLINYDLNRKSQVGFYRVLGSAPDERAITIDGSDFTITDNLADGTANRSKTFVIYLPNVVSVFQKQLILEPEAGF